jgi:hypothetical protein
MKYKKGPLDYFLQQRISDNAEELKRNIANGAKLSRTNTSKHKSL